MPGDKAGGAAPHRRRDLVDAILDAVHRACDVREFEVAQRLLGSAEEAMKTRRESDPALLKLFISRLASAHERLWSLRNAH